MHGIDMRPGQLSHRRQMVQPVRLDRGGSARLVPLGTGFALREQPLLHGIDRLGILAMGCDDHAEVFGHREHAEEVLV